MRQAHASGRLGPFDPLDRHSWRQLRWTLDLVEKENLNHLGKLRVDLACALLTSAKSNKERQKQWTKAARLHKRIADRLFPWLASEDESNRDQEIEKLAAAWRQHFGDPDDPAVQKKIANTVAALRQRIHSRG